MPIVSLWSYKLEYICFDCISKLVQKKIKQQICKDCSFSFTSGLGEQLWCFARTVTFVSSFDDIFFELDRMHVIGNYLYKETVKYRSINIKKMIQFQFTRRAILQAWRRRDLGPIMKMIIHPNVVSVITLTLTYLGLGTYGKLHKFPVSQILNSNIYLIELYLDNDWILILEKLIFKSISTFYYRFPLSGKKFRVFCATFFLKLNFRWKILNFR